MSRIARTGALLALMTVSFASIAENQAADDDDGVLQELKALGAKDSKQVSDLVKSLTIDMPVTTSPATFVLGAAGTSVPRVATWRKFAVDVGSALDDNGKIAKAVAFEINPYLASGPVSWTSYRESPAVQILTRTTLSVATKTGSDDGSAQTAFGIQSVLFSKEAAAAIDQAHTGDCTSVARAFANKRLGTISGEIKVGVDLSNAGPTGAVPTEEERKKQEAEDHAHVDKCRKNLAGLLTKWNPTSLAVGFGQSFYSSTASANGLKRYGSGVWITGTYGVDFGDPNSSADDKKGLGLTLHLRRMTGQRTNDPTNSSLLVSQDVNIGGLNARFGNARWGVIAEGSLSKAKAPGLSDEKRKRAVLAAEYKISEGLYVSLGIGNDTGRRDGKNQHMTLANLKWGFGDKPVLGF